MLAALLVEPGRIIVDEVAEPPVDPGDVRIAVGGVGLCGSDLAIFHGKWTAPRYPWVMGHEAFGVIEAVGEGVDRTRMGQVVVIEPNIACRDCAECARGRTSTCLGRQSLGMNRPGALAGKVVVPADLAWPADRRDPRDLVCVEPYTVSETALRRLPSALPADALVIGAGAQGLLMCLALQRRGITVHVVDVNADRIAFAVDQLGAMALAPDDHRTFELIVDTTGLSEAMTDAVRHSEIGATIIEIGLERQPLELAAETLVRRQLVLRGSLTYDHPADFRWSVGLVNAGEVSPGRVISDEHPFADSQRAFEASATAPGKTWIRLASP
jgi:alcohol dehydrogenase/L-iditol 2-dehydrogenase